MKSTRLQKHLAKVHPKAMLLRKETPKKAVTIPSQKSKGQNPKSTKAGLGWKEDQVQPLEAFRQPFATRAQARTTIFEFIEAWYNRQRLHSSLDYLSPMEFERKSRH